MWHFEPHIYGYFKAPPPYVHYFRGDGVWIYKTWNRIFSRINLTFCSDPSSWNEWQSDGHTHTHTQADRLVQPATTSQQGWTTRRIMQLNTKEFAIATFNPIWFFDFFCDPCWSDCAIWIQWEHIDGYGDRPGLGNIASGFVKEKTRLHLTGSRQINHEHPLPHAPPILSVSLFKTGWLSPYQTSLALEHRVSRIYGGDHSAVLETKLHITLWRPA